MKALSHVQMACDVMVGDDENHEKGEKKRLREEEEKWVGGERERERRGRGWKGEKKME